MTSAAVNGLATCASDAERAAVTAHVEEALRLLGKASRAHQLYMQNNPTYLRALELLRAGFQPLWENMPELVVAVAENELQWEGKAVYAELERSSDTLPWLLFKDGIRELRITPGFEEGEIEQFLEVLRQLRRAAAQEDDAITLLWERDFACLRYRFVEPPEAEEVRPFVAGQMPGLRGEAATIERGELEQGAGSGFVDMKDFEAAAHFLTQREVDYLRNALDEEYNFDLHTDAVHMLLDTLEQERAPDVRGDVCDALDVMLVHFLASGSYRAVAHLLVEVDAAVSRTTTLDAGVRDRLAQLRERLSSAEGVGQLLDALDVAAPPPPQAELDDLLSQLQPRALGHVLGRLQYLSSPSVRESILGAADRLALASTSELVRLVTSDDPVVALEAVRRAGALKSAGAVSALGSLIVRASGDLRIAAAQALAEIGSPTALQLLADLLEDGEREVRLAAARAVATHRFRGALQKVEATIKGKRLREADLTEQMTVFEAYGTICGDAGVNQLDNLLNGRSMLGRRPDPSVRACAAVALGRVGTAAARESLGKASDERDPVVRTAVQRAMRGGN